MMDGIAMEVQQDEVLTIEELAAYLKVSKSTLYKLVQEGKLPGQKVGKHWRFLRSTIDDWLGKNHSDEPAKQPVKKQAKRPTSRTRRTAK
jgi:excisionase family DNA binding protein